MSIELISTGNAAAMLWRGDVLDVLPLIPDNSIDAVVTDPPYELGFMGRAWDASGIAYNVDLWKHCLRVAKPGGHLLAFGGTRTYHRLTCAVEDAGFEIRDEIAWLYGSGFPKSLDVSKAIDKAAGAERDVVGARDRYRDGRERLDRGNVNNWGGTFGTNGVDSVTAPATDDAKRWSGWGTALKPAHEPIVVARKPFAGTVAANVLAHGTGALNVDGCRVEHAGAADLAASRAKNPGRADLVTSDTYGASRPQQSVNDAGRWPSNVVLDEYAAEELDRQSGTIRSAGNYPTTYSNSGGYGGALGLGVQGPLYDDTGGASRFFPVFRYQAKAPTRERPKVDGVAHPTVKPLELMRWLVRLVTPPGGQVLEPFAGSGTTIEACLLEGMRCLAIERDKQYIPLIRSRIGDRQL